MTTDTTTQLPDDTALAGRTGADRNNRLAWPATAMAIGVVLATAGLVLGRWRHTVPGNFRMDAVQVDNECSTVGQVVGHTITTPMCSHAHSLLDLCGVMILAGAVMALTGIVMTVRRLRPSF